MEIAVPTSYRHTMSNDYRISKVSEVIKNAWELPYKRTGLPLDKAARIALGVVDFSHGVQPSPFHLWKHFGSQSYEGYLSGMEHMVAQFHVDAIKGKKNGLWAGDHYVHWNDLHSNQKLDSTLIYLAGNVANNIEKLTRMGSLKIEDEHDILLRKHLLLDQDPYGSAFLDERSLDKVYLPEIEIKGTVPGNVRYEIEYAWRTRQKPQIEYSGYGHSRQFVVNREDSLPWRKLAVVGLSAIYGLKNLNQISDTGTLENLANTINHDMITHKLWGEDTEKYMYYESGLPKKFRYQPRENAHGDEHLSDWRQKENIVLILYATLSGLTDAMVYKGQRTFDMHKRGNEVRLSNY